MADGLVAAQGREIRAERLAAVGQAAASVGHDLRNPLGAIRNANHYIKRRVGDSELASNERVNQFFAIIDRELDASAKIIADLLDFARDRRLTLSACPLKALVADAISVVSPPRPTRIDNRLRGDLPVLCLDRDQMRQALVNLLQNASEAVPEEREGHIVITATADDDKIVLSIEDNGGGIPEEERARIFEPFFTTKNKGTGLGLAITGGIIQRHGGSIELRSEADKGTTFLLHLPRKGGERESRPQPDGGMAE
jgi:signal transduction histidine kinase